jgi:hypothetical protein
MSIEATQIRALIDLETQSWKAKDPRKILALM